VVKVIVVLVVMLAAGLRGWGQDVKAASAAPQWPGAGRLVVGTCYQPADRTPAQVRADIALMQKAGFTLVRMGDLEWDSFEPREGVFTFAWFDAVVAQMQAAGMKVLLDVSGLPAPLWLHAKYPEVNLMDEHGDVVQPAERYMVDIGAPAYRTHVLAFAEALTKHYAHNPTVVAVGYDNEIGNGFMSYSAGDRQRFIAWLKVRYGSLGALNKAWSTEDWSRRLDSFDEVQLPYEDGPGPPERYLDLRRYWSSVTVDVLKELEQVRERNMPGLPAASNLWSDAGRKGFDYLATYKQYATYGTEGFYPGSDASAALHASMGVLLTKGDLDTPTWFDEFVTGGPGNYGGPKGKIRMWAYLGLIDYGQTFLAWTFNTHAGGEEQALWGLLDHDGTPSWKYDEFAQIATEFKKLQGMGFPRVHRPEVAIAYSFDSWVATQVPGGNNSVRAYFKTSYEDQVADALEPLFDDNIDTALIDVGHAQLDYKLVVVPADYIMDPKSAAALRAYVQGGGTVVMTAYSAKADEHSQWFETPLPGLLSDVFGVRTSQFYRPKAMPELVLDGKTVTTTQDFYEVLEPRGAETLARFTNTEEKSPAVTVHRYGKGRAIYVAVPAQDAVLRPLLRGLYAELGIVRGPVTPAGVYARVVQGRTLYVNTTAAVQRIAMDGEARGVVSGAQYAGAVVLPPYGAELVETAKRTTAVP
jgi:beta-galactosidase